MSWLTTSTASCHSKLFMNIWRQYLKKGLLRIQFEHFPTFTWLVSHTNITCHIYPCYAMKLVENCFTGKHWCSFSSLCVSYLIWCVTGKETVEADWSLLKPIIIMIKFSHYCCCFGLCTLHQIQLQNSQTFKSCATEHVVTGEACWSC